MRRRRSLSIPVFVVSGLFLAAGASAAETFWTLHFGELVAFDVDFQDGSAEYTMQLSGDQPDGASYFAAARHPLTGELWVSYFDPRNGRQGVGRLLPGESRPEPGVELSEGYDFARLLRFSPDGILYALVEGVPANLGFLATIDLQTGLVEPVLSYQSPDSVSGFAIHPLTGVIYLAGGESCQSGCVMFLDTLTGPQHLRERILTFSFYGPPSPIFSESGELLVMMGAFYRIQNGTLTYFSEFPRISSPLGPLSYTMLQEGSPAEGTDGCVPSRTRACLLHRRFALEATYDATDHGMPAGTAKPVLESDESVTFTFFSPEIPEVFVKILDGCGYNDHTWIFASGLTNLGVSLRVTDTETGQVYSHENAPGQLFAPLLDIEAFPCAQD
jgi:hypothetical protein